MNARDTFNYEDAARLLALLDVCKGEDLDVASAGLRLQVSCWESEPKKGAECISAEGTIGDRLDSVGTADAGVAILPAQTVGIFHALTDERQKRFVLIGETIGSVQTYSGAAADVISPIEGELIDICVDDGEFVAYGQAIAVIATRTRDDASQACN